METEKLTRSKARWLAAGVLLLVLLVALPFIWPQGKRSSGSGGETNAVPGSAAGGKYFQIGVFAPREGGFAPAGTSIENGAAAAAEKINSSGGILGRPVKLDIVDSRAQPEVVRDLARALVQRAKVSLLIGTADEEETRAAAETAAELHVPFIYPANGPAKTCPKGDDNTVSHYVWGTGITDEMSIEPLLIYLAQKVNQPEKDPRFYFFVTNIPKMVAQAKVVRQTAEDLSIQIVTADYVDERIRDYFQNIRSIFAQRPDVLFVATSQKNTRPFMEQAAKLNVQRDTLITGLSVFQEEAVSSMGKVTDGVLTVDRYSHLLDNPQNKEFLLTWKKLFPANEKPPSALAAATYSSLLIAQAAFNKAQSADPLAFEQAMNDLVLQLPQGPVSVSSQNHLLVQPLYAVTLEDGRYKPVEFLGDASHPALEGCSINKQAAPPPAEEDDED